MGVMLFGVFWLLIPWIWKLKQPLWPCVAAIFFIFAGLVLPIALKPVYILWMRLGAILGWVNQRLILGIIFFIFFLPMGLLFKCLRRDVLSRRLNKKTVSYRIPSQQPSKKNLDKPF